MGELVYIVVHFMPANLLSTVVEFVLGELISDHTTVRTRGFGALLRTVCARGLIVILLRDSMEMGS